MLGALYLGVTLATLIGTRKQKVCLLGSVALLMWTGLEKGIYQFGVVEVEDTQLITSVFVLYVIIAGYYFKHWLFLALAGVGLGALLWTTKGGLNAYDFKAGKNALFLLGLVLVWVSYMFYRRESVSLWLRSHFWPTKY